MFYQMMFSILGIKHQAWGHCHKYQLQLQKNYNKFRLPALPVQREIVRILDEFTKLSAELNAAELAARKKQYEYYRDIYYSAT